MDPCLDDCIEMAKKLKKLGVSIGLDVLPGLPHGFLSFVKVSFKSNKNEWIQNNIRNYFKLFFFHCLIALERSVWR